MSVCDILFVFSGFLGECLVSIYWICGCVCVSVCVFVCVSFVCLCASVCVCVHTQRVRPHLVCAQGGHCLVNQAFRARLSLSQKLSSEYESFRTSNRTFNVFVSVCVCVFWDCVCVFVCYVCVLGGLNLYTSS